jgi:inosine/xanthosine triphosphatase
MNVAVASKNPVKINASKLAFDRAFDTNVVAEGFSIPSGVSDNPMTDAETFSGAKNRAEGLMKAVDKPFDYFVGIEGGCEIMDDFGMVAFAWMYVIRGDDKNVGYTRTSFFKLPPKVAELVTNGMELGTADDIVFNMKNSKQNNGSIGILTNNIFTRESFYMDAIIISLIPFLHNDLY